MPGVTAFPALSILDSTLGGRSVLTTTRYYASGYGASPSATSTVNRNSIQAMVDAVVASGLPGHCIVDVPGVYLVAGGSTGYYGTGKLCIDVSNLLPGSSFEIAAGVTLKLPDGVMTGSTLWYDMIGGDKADLDVLVFGDGTIDMNSVGNPGWVPGYGQYFGSCAVRFSCEVGSFRKVHVKGLRITNCYANATHLTGRGNGIGGTRFGGIGINEELYCTNCGEGPQVDICRHGYAIRNELAFNDNWVGDYLEMVLCDQAYWIGNCAYHVNGTIPPTGGAFMDASGTLYAYMANNWCKGCRGGFSATTFSTLTEYPNRRNIYTYCANYTHHDCPGSTVQPGEGQSDWYGLQLYNCSGGIFLTQDTAAYTDQHHRFYSPQLPSSSPFVFNGGAIKVTLTDPRMTSNGEQFQFRQLNTNSNYGVPDVTVRGGSMTSGSFATFLINGANYPGVYRPRVLLDGTECTFNSSTGLITTSGSLADPSGIIYNSAIIDANSSKKEGVLATVRVAGMVATQTRLFRIPIGQRVSPTAVVVRAVQASNVTTNVTLRVGTASGYADIAASSTLTLTTEGMQRTATLNTASAFPAGGTSAPGTDVYVDVTTASDGYLILEVDLVGELVAVPVLDSPANISNFRVWYRWPFGLYTDTGGTTPVTAVGDNVGAWAKHLGTGTNLAATGSGTRVVQGSISLIGNSTGWLQNTMDLSGPYTIVARVKAHTTTGTRGFFSAWMGSSGWLVRSNAVEFDTINFYDSADAVSTELSTTASTVQVVGVAVANDGTTALFKPDGTSVAAAGGTTARSATATFTALSGLLGGSPAEAEKGLLDIVVFDKVLTTAEFQRVMAILAQ